MANDRGIDRLPIEQRQRVAGRSGRNAFTGTPDTEERFVETVRKLAEAGPQHRSKAAAKPAKKKGG
jgi:hypothetical protein